MKGPFYIVQATTCSPSNPTPKVSYMYVDTECGVLFTDSLRLADWFRKADFATERLDYVLREDPTGYSVGSLPGKQYAIPGRMRSACDGKVSDDGRYELNFKVIEILGGSLDKLETCIVREEEVIAIQFHNEYDKKPELTFKTIK